MRAYSVDLRQRVLAACDDGMGTAEAAESFAVSQAWVRRIKQRRQEGGGRVPRTRGRTGPVPVLADLTDLLPDLPRSCSVAAWAYRSLLLRCGRFLRFRVLRPLGPPLLRLVGPVRHRV